MIKNFKTAEGETQPRAFCDCMGHKPMKLALVGCYPQCLTTILETSRFRVVVL